MWAVRSNFPAAVELYLEYGAEINARTRTGKTPAARPPGAGGGSHGAGIVRSGWPEQGFQGETPGGMTPLLYAARDGRIDIAKTLVAAKADVQQADVNGITPLLMAITNNHLDVAKFFVEKGANPNAADWWGRTPLYATVEIRNRDYGRNNEHEIDRPAALEVIRMLLDRADRALDPAVARASRHGDTDLALAGHDERRRLGRDHRSLRRAHRKLPLATFRGSRSASARSSSA